MTVMNEMVLSIKLVKFLGWEKEWTRKALDAREVEMRQIMRARTNSLCSDFLWNLSPILVMLICECSSLLKALLLAALLTSHGALSRLPAFLFFVTLGKGELTVSIAL